MADTSASTGSEALESETPTQRQARLRREKRQKKMVEQGEDRLARIKALNGGVAPPDEVLGGSGVQDFKNASVADDPEEIDISRHQQADDTGAQNPLMAAMLQMQQQQQRQPQQSPGGDNPQEDPMVRLMQQVMGSMGGQRQDPNNPNAEQTQLPDLLQQMMKGSQPQEQKAPSTSTAYMWRIVHAIAAFILASYIALTSTFNGTKLARTQSVYSQEAGYGLGPRLFVIFTSAELVLQSSRYFLEKGQLQGTGILATVANSGMIPEPYANYIRLIGRYIGIATTIFSDMMVVIFVFGCMAWWNGMVVA